MNASSVVPTVTPMARLRMRGLVAACCLTTLLAAAAGCGDGAESDPSSTVDDALFPASDVIWTTLSIPVCWTNPANGTLARRTAVRDQIKLTWEAFSLVRFTGWGTCAASSTGIRIEIQNGATVMPRTNGIGRAIAQGTKVGMVLNLAPVSGTPVCPALVTPDVCILGHAVHEFGHALGFDGEDQRPDSSANCTGPAVGNVLVGFPDLLSVMNHCNPGRIFGALSLGDQEGVQQFYGNPTSVGRRKDAIMWDADTLFFMHGRKYTRFTPSLSRTDDYYPAQIFNDWDGWPSGWSDGVDAMTEFSTSKVYMFRGNQYLRYDKTTDTADAGYPKTLPGGWSNWPATWTSIDAAIKWPTNGKVYMFRGPDYIRVTGTVVDAGFPRKIVDNWAIPWTTGFDYVVNYPNGMVYFFKDTQYIRYDPNTHVVSSPRNIAGAWPGVMF